MADFQRLVFTKADFTNLSELPSAHTLVLQFNYDGVHGDGIPNLRVFAMKQNHKKIKETAFRDLQPEPIVRPPLSLPDRRLQGDQQVKIEDLKEILKNSNKPSSAYDYFLLTPKCQAAGGYILYEFEVVPTTLQSLAIQKIMADPSPPATAI